MSLDELDDFLDLEDEERCTECDCRCCVCGDADYHCVKCGRQLGWQFGENGKCFMCFELDGYT